MVPRTDPKLHEKQLYFPSDKHTEVIRKKQRVYMNCSYPNAQQRLVGEEVSTTKYVLRSCSYCEVHLRKAHFDNIHAA